jgi:hypothetical protein
MHGMQRRNGTPVHVKSKVTGPQCIAMRIVWKRNQNRQQGDSNQHWHRSVLNLQGQLVWLFCWKVAYVLVLYFIVIQLFERSR